MLLNMVQSEVKVMFRLMYDAATDPQRQYASSALNKVGF